MGLFNPLTHPICLNSPHWLKHSTWTIHIPFGMLLIDLLRPETIVELGTYYGVSYCAFCQAVKAINLQVQCYAIDTWQGDPQSGYYGAAVLAELQGYHDPLYGDFSHLLQSSFDDARSRFADSSIDLLHIDGLHTYEAVKHDFETWRPKLSSRAVVLFHDVTVKAPGFGVWQLWEELKAHYPSFEIAYGHGLGLLALGQQAQPRLSELLEISGDDLVRFHDLFYQLGSRLELAIETQTLRQQSNEQAEAIGYLQGQLQLYDRLSQFLIVRALRVWLQTGLSGIPGRLWLKLRLPVKAARKS